MKISISHQRNFLRLSNNAKDTIYIRFSKTKRRQFFLPYLFLSLYLSVCPSVSFSLCISLYYMYANICFHMCVYIQVCIYLVFSVLSCICPEGVVVGEEGQKEEIAQNKKRWLRNPLEGTEGESYVRAKPMISHRSSTGIFSW